MIGESGSIARPYTELNIEDVANLVEPMSALQSGFSYR